MDEGVGNLEFEAALNLESTRTVTVDWALADGTAVAGEDYTAASGTLTFVPGDTVKTITVAVRDDALDEDDETFEVALSGETNAAVSERRASVTIRDNDGMPSLEIADADTDEGENQTFAVTLSPVSGRAVTVEWATADGTAASRADYDTATGTLTFPAGQTSQTITVETEEDALDEDDETFTVTLSSAVNAAIGDAGATGTIRDDDPEPSLLIGDGSASEGAASMNFEVTLSEVSGREVTVDWATSKTAPAASGATAPADYDTATGTLTFPAGQTSQTITVTVRDDTLDEDGRDVHRDPERRGERGDRRRRRDGHDRGRRRGGSVVVSGIPKRGRGCREPGVRGGSEPGEHEDGDGGLGAGRRDRGCRRGLHRGERDPDLRAGRHGEDDHGGGAGRRARRGRRDLRGDVER